MKEIYLGVMNRARQHGAIAVAFASALLLASSTGGSAALAPPAAGAAAEIVAGVPQHDPPRVSASAPGAGGPGTGGPGTGGPALEPADDPAGAAGPGVLPADRRALPSGARVDDATAGGANGPSWTARRVARSAAAIFLLGALAAAFLRSGTLQRLRRRIEGREQRFRVLAEALRDGIVVVDEEGRVRYANPTACELLGCTPSKVEGARAESLLPRDPEIAERVARRRTTPLIGHLATFERPDRPALALEVGIDPHPVGDRGAIGSLVTFSDVTDRLLAEEQVRYQASLLDAVHQAVIATDLDGRIRFWNHYAEELYGWSREEVLGRDILELTAPPGTAETAQEIIEALRSGRTWSGEFEVGRRDGTTFPALVTDSPIYDAAGELAGVVGISSDLSERKELEEQLRQAQKMEAIGRLAGGIAHDFNNVLMAILGHAELLGDRLGEESELREELAQIEAAAGRAASLITQLLAFSRRQTLDPRPLDTSRVLHETAQLISRIVGEDVELVVEVEPVVWPIRADRVQIEQALLNLATNARDAMPGGGRLEIAAANVRLGGDEPGIAGRVEAGDWVRIEVSDDGEGIRPEHLPMLFDPFFTTKEFGRGTGLGLASVYGVVQEGGGELRVASELGGGTTFTLFFPRSDEVPAPPETPAPARRPEAPTGGDETILLVEDQLPLRSLIRRALARSGYRVIEAADGMEGEALAETHPGPIHLLLTDVLMPRMGGTELARRVRASRPETRVIFMSGNPEREARPEELEGDGGRYLAKPFTLSTLLARVREVVDEGQAARTPVEAG